MYHTSAINTLDMALSGLSFPVFGTRTGGSNLTSTCRVMDISLCHVFTDFLDKLGQGLSNLYLNGQPALSGLLPIPLK